MSLHSVSEFWPIYCMCISKNFLSSSPQKRRAYLANLLNAISAIASRKEEILHESLALFIQKVFIVMGPFAYENETKTLLKLFISNLSSESSVIRRCASTSISVITFNNRKPDVMLALVLDYLLGNTKY